eukprot:gene5859-9687_t
MKSVTEKNNKIGIFIDQPCDDLIKELIQNQNSYQNSFHFFTEISDLLKDELGQNIHKFERKENNTINLINYMFLFALENPNSVILVISNLDLTQSVNILASQFFEVFQITDEKSKKIFQEKYLSKKPNDKPEMEDGLASWDDGNLRDVEDILEEEGGKSHISEFIESDEDPNEFKQFCERHASRLLLIDDIVYHVDYWNEYKVNPIPKKLNENKISNETKIMNTTSTIQKDNKINPSIENIVLKKIEKKKDFELIIPDEINSPVKIHTAQEIVTGTFDDEIYDADIEQILDDYKDKKVHVCALSSMICVHCATRIPRLKILLEKNPKYSIGKHGFIKKVK